MSTLTTIAADNYPHQTTSAELWTQFRRAPYTHPNLPNVSFAGYRFSERPLPEPAVVANVRIEGAKGDGQADDTAAFKAAIAKAIAAHGGAILVPAGTYKLSEVITLTTPGLVLRGEGQDKTILAFSKPVSQMVPGVSGAWFGGAIWISPDKPQPEINPQPAANTVAVTRPAKQGDFSVEVADAGKLTPLIGKMVQLAWRGDLSLCRHIAGHPSLDAFNWSSWGAFRDGTLTWLWANQIERVAGNTITFKKPLRLDIAANWKVAIATSSSYVTECGVEKLTIRFPVTPKAAHLKEPGWNGVLFHRAANCFARQLVIENADVGINFSDESVNNTATDWVLKGRPNHHATAMRNMSHDNLLQNFRIESQPHHGLNTEGTSSGNVWRRGEMKFGTFDSHCMMSFDSVRTDIAVNNTGGPGGAKEHGPFVGRRMSHWNIRITNGKGEWIAQPAILPNGTIAGIQGAPLELKATGLWHLPEGLDKGCVVADHGKVPAPADLFEAQLQFRLQGR
jgi:hypothetical protein